MAALPVGRQHGYSDIHVLVLEHARVEDLDCSMYSSVRHAITYLIESEKVVSSTTEWSI